MADTNALIKIDEAITRFMLKYEKSTNRFFSYLERACQCYVNFNLYDANIVTYQKVTLDALGKWIDMPDDMIEFKDLVSPINGSFWPASEQDGMVITTTTTGGIEGQDSAQGEGVTIDQPRITGYGAKGGWNKFKYKLDWKQRRIYMDTAITDYLVLLYVPSGINASGDTQVPLYFLDVIDDYLQWKDAVMDGRVQEEPMREQRYYYTKKRVKDMIYSMSLAQWQDLIYKNITQSPQR